MRSNYERIRKRLPFAIPDKSDPGEALAAVADFFCDVAEAALIDKEQNCCKEHARERLTHLLIIMHQQLNHRWEEVYGETLFEMVKVQKKVIAPKVTVKSPSNFEDDD